MFPAMAMNFWLATRWVTRRAMSFYLVRLAGALIVVVSLSACNAPGEAEIAEGNRLAAEGKLAEAAASYRAACDKSQRAKPRELLGMVLHAAGKSAEAREA